MEGEGLHLGVNSPKQTFPRHGSLCKRLKEILVLLMVAPLKGWEVPEQNNFWEVFGQGQALLAKGTNDLIFILPLFPMLMLSNGATALHQLVLKPVL